MFFSSQVFDEVIIFSTLNSYFYLKKSSCWTIIILISLFSCENMCIIFCKKTASDNVNICTVSENNIGAPKMLHNFGASKLSVFATSIEDFSLLLLVKFWLRNSDGSCAFLLLKVKAIRLSWLFTTTFKIIKSDSNCCRNS